MYLRPRKTLDVDAWLSDQSRQTLTDKTQSAVVEMAISKATEEFIEAGGLETDYERFVQTSAGGAAGNEPSGTNHYVLGSSVSPGGLTI